MRRYYPSKICDDRGGGSLMCAGYRCGALASGKNLKKVRVQTSHCFSIVLFFLNKSHAFCGT